MISVFVVCTMAFLLLSASSCDGTSSAEQNDRAVTDKQLDIYNKAQPVHLYNYSMPRDVMQQIYDSIMTAHNTWTVFFEAGIGAVDMCPSVGFPIPGGTQLTNPEKPLWNNSASATIPQAEPTGLYPPAGSSDSTWVLCVYNGKVEPRYSEPHVMTYTHPVKVENGKIIHLDGASSITININSPSSPVVDTSPSPSPSR